jgi:hypothetical protein
VVDIQTPSQPWDAEVALIRIIVGYRLSQLVRALAGLCVPDHLEAGPLTVADLAARIEADPGALYRLLRGAATVGLLDEVSPRTFQLNGMSELLCSKRGSLRPMAMAMTAPGCWLPWSRVVESVRTGEAQARPTLGVDYWEYLRTGPAEAGELQRSATRRLGVLVPQLPTLFDFSGCALVVDVAGGHGALLGGILRANPGRRGILFDVPEVVAGIDQADVPEGCELVGGDAFVAVPAGGDAYLLKEALHNWVDDDAVRVLSRCREAMAAGGRVLVIEQVLPPDGERSAAHVTDLQMLVVTGGLERTRDEFERIMVQAGLRLDEVVPIETNHRMRGWSLLVASAA